MGLAEAIRASSGSNKSSPAMSPAGRRHARPSVLEQARKQTRTAAGAAPGRGLSSPSSPAAGRATPKTRGHKSGKGGDGDSDHADDDDDNDDDGESDQLFTEDELYSMYSRVTKSSRENLYRTQDHDSDDDDDEEDEEDEHGYSSANAGNSMQRPRQQHDETTKQRVHGGGMSIQAVSKAMYGSLDDDNDDDDDDDDGARGRDSVKARRPSSHEATERDDDQESDRFGFSTSVSGQSLQARAPASRAGRDASNGYVLHSSSGAGGGRARVDSIGADDDDDGGGGGGGTGDRRHAPPLPREHSHLHESMFVCTSNS